MTSAIWKYPLAIEDSQEVFMPRGAKILTVQMQHGLLCLWAWVDPDAPAEPRTIRIYGTGHPVRQARVYLGTVQQAAGALVWHIFEA